MATLVLARHGETPWNRAGRIQGWAPVGLSAAGREQALALGRHLDDAYEADRLVCSDLRRAVETARLVRRSHAAAPDLDRDTGWRERDVGVLQGLTREALFEGHPEFSLLQSGPAAATERPEGGERWIDARARALRATDRLVRSVEPGETAVVVTHGGPIRHVLAALLELDAVETVSRLDPPNCSVTELLIDESDGPAPATGAVAGTAAGSDAAAAYEPAFPAVASIERRADAAFLAD